MTKKTLVLRKETVRTLSEVSLEKAVGGTTSDTNFYCTGGLCASVGCAPMTLSGCPKRIITSSDIC